jgi:hypothetical protein
MVEADSMPSDVAGGGGTTWSAVAMVLTRKVAASIGPDTLRVLRHLYRDHVARALLHIWESHDKSTDAVRYAHKALVRARARRRRAPVTQVLSGGALRLPGIDMITIDKDGGGQVDWSHEIKAVTTAVRGVLGAATLETLTYMYPGTGLPRALIHAWECHGRDLAALARSAAACAVRVPRHTTDPRVLAVPLRGPRGRTTMARARDALTMRVLRDRYDAMYGGTLRVSGDDPGPRQVPISENALHYDAYMPPRFDM